MKKLSTVNKQSGNGYTKKGPKYLLKDPIEIDEALWIKGLSRDKNGNALMLLLVGYAQKPKSIQYKQGGMSTIYIDELASGEWVKNNKKDVQWVIDYVNKFVKKSTVNVAKDKDRLESLIEFEGNNYEAARDLLKDMNRNLQGILNKRVFVDAEKLDPKKPLNVSTIPEYLDSMNEVLEELFEAEEAMFKYMEELNKAK